MLDEEKVIEEELRWEKQKELLERKQKIKKEKKALRPKLFSTTKLLIFFLFLNCTIIELFTGWVTIQSLRISSLTGMMTDFTPLITLIGAVVGEVIGFGIYAVKSAKENSIGGITYEMAMMHNSDETVG